MRKFQSADIITKMKSIGLVPLFTHDDAGVAREVVEAAYLGGVRVFEFTNRRANSFQVFTEVLQYTEKYPDLMLGIGTIMDGPMTQKFIDAGAHFIISPIVKPEMGAVCAKENVPWLPGCATVTEVALAREHGAQMIKIFPGSVLGPGFVSAIMPVMPDLQLMITGGVEPNEKNLSAWFGAGASCVGMGSQLFTKEILATRDWRKLGEVVKSSLEIIQRVRK